MTNKFAVVLDAFGATQDVNMDACIAVNFPKQDSRGLFYFGVLYGCETE